MVTLNVLEHIEDDVEALRQIYRILKPGGAAIIEVPAGPKLYDIYDELLMHHRRYSLSGLADKAKSVGFRVTCASHLGAFIYPPFYIAKMRNQRSQSSDVESKQQRVAEQIRQSRGSGLLRTLLRLERFIGRWCRWPFGIRCTMTLVK